MQLLIRDDDLSYFARPQDLETIYRKIWDKCPISFAVIPFVSTKGYETPLDVHSDKLYALGENKKLVAFLKQKIKEKKITIVQHGFSHQDYGKKGKLFELERQDQEQLYQELKKGKDYLEQLFGIEIKTLVAPHDRFSKEAILAAERVGYEYICRAFAPLPREIQFNWVYLHSYWELFLFWLKNGRKYRYPTILDFGRHKEIYAYRPNELIGLFDQIIKFHQEYQNSVLCVTTHYRSMNIHTKELLMELIRKTNRFVTFNSVDS